MKASDYEKKFIDMINDNKLEVGFDVSLVISDVVEYAKQLESQLEWIPVSERLPDFDHEVLWYCHQGIWVEALDKDEDIGLWLDRVKATHWREIGPLP